MKEKTSNKFCLPDPCKIVFKYFTPIFNINYILNRHKLTENTITEKCYNHLYEFISIKCLTL